MPPDQLIAWLQGLPPEVQQAMMQMVIGQGQGQFPVNPYSGISPMTAYQYTPQLDKNGNEQPWDVDVAQDNLNLQQDLRYNTFRPELAAMAGPGAFGVGAFDPVMTNAAEVNAPRPGESMLANAATMDPTSYDGFVAQYLAQNPNAGPGEAQRAFWDQANAVEDDGVTPTPSAQLLLDSLPQREVEDPASPGQFVLRPDRNAPLDFATTIHSELLKDQQVAPQYEESEAAKFYSEQGLPTPVEQYGQGKYSTEALVPGYAEAQGQFAMADDQYAAAKANMGDRKKQHEAMLRQVLASKEAPRTQAQPTFEPTTPGVNIPIGANMQVDSGTGGMTMGVGPKIPGMGYVGGEIQLAAPATQRQVEAPGPPAPDMLPTTTGRRPTQGGQVDTGRRMRASERGFEQAKKDRRAAYREANSPEALYQNRMNQAMQQQGRTPLNDALMQRQIAMYLSGAFGPRG